MAEIVLPRELISILVKLPARQMWTDYDEEADVLYISFRKPQQANDSILENDFIYHYHDAEVVGITVMNASQHS
jgi:uncharacterized protein YuzE